MSSYLDAGIYTIPAAARLIGVSQAKIRGWISGYHHSKSAPIVVNELGRLGHRVALSFKNLIEALFIKGFAEHDISIQAIREMALEARRIVQDQHPFATDIVFRTDNRSIFAEIIDVGAARDKKLYNLRNRNWAMEQIMRPFLMKAVKYGPAGYANQWYPRADKAPNVLVTPTVSFGQPTIHRVPTRALADAVRAERRDYKTVAKWFELTTSDVKEAYRFQTRLVAH